MEVPRTADTRVVMLVLYGLEVGEGVGENADPFVLREFGESRVYSDEFCPHDGAGLFRSCFIYIDGNVGGYVNHRRA